MAATSADSRTTVFCLSAGRCGTQWLASTLRGVYPGLTEAEHEPLGPLYSPRRYFRRYDDPQSILEVPEVRRHLERVRALPHYVETGWPSFPALPLLARELGHSLRVVHLTRHPVPSALSHLAHNSFAGSDRDDNYTRLATLGPRDPNVFQPDYAERWTRLSDYEKCLFWWTEVHLFALELEARVLEIPILRLRSEDLLAGERSELRRLVSFMRLPWDERVAERASRRVDRWHHHAAELPDPGIVAAHPRTVEVAARLGYDATDFRAEALERRYRGRPDPGLDRFARRSAGTV